MENIELSRRNPLLEIIVLSVWVPTICYVWEQKCVLEWHPLWIEKGDFLQATTTLLNQQVMGIRVLQDGDLVQVQLIIVRSLL